MSGTGRVGPAIKPSTLVEAIYKREIVPWAFLGLSLGLVEGATAAVLVKVHFVGVVSPLMLNLAVSLVSGAPALSNVVSFVWANVAHGRERVRLLVGLQAVFALLVGLVSLASRERSGLVLTVLSVVAARAIWAGVLTVRAAVWTSNYPRNVLARITGRIVIVNSLAVAASAALVGWALEAGDVDPRWVYGGGAVAGLIAAWLYRDARVRRQFLLLRAETSSGPRGQAFSLSMFRQILAEDPSFRGYMFWMGLFGAGNLMLIAQLVVIFAERLHLSSGVQIALLSVVPLVTLPLFTPWWARLFDGSHILVYRSKQGWALVMATFIMCLATFTGWLPALWIGAIMLGAANAGANLGWNLGHNDFASIGRAQHYMGVHVTLTGVRGALAPPLGILFYEALEAFERGAGEFALLLPLGLTTAGAIGFNLMRRDLQR
ncbi:MAG TPA: MFS transporter [Steroidobacteraceae bacterium]|nr:MFS transporter [Steroidobacteraceae bacterium]